MRTIVVFLLAGALALGQGTGRVEGRVMDGDGVPVPKATVRLISMAGPTPLTAYVEVADSSGRFSAEGLLPGTYQASSQRAGYVVPSSPTLGRAATFTVVAGETRNVDVKMVRLGQISGTITDADGDAVPGTTVRLLRYNYLGSRMTLAPAATSVSDDRGQFRLLSIAAGRYYLVAAPAAQNSGPLYAEVRGRSALVSNLPTYFPGVAELSGAKMVEVGSAAVDNLNVRLLRGPTYTIKGTVTGTRGGAPSFVTLIPKSAEVVPLQLPVTLRPTGEFETVGVAPGEYVLLVRSATPANSAPTRFGRANVMVRGNVTGVSLRMTDNIDLTGKLSIEGVADMGSFMAGATALRGVPPPGVTLPRMPTLSLMAADNLPVPTAPVQVEDDGVLRPVNVAPVAYTLSISNLPPGAFVKSVQVNGEPVMENRVDLSGLDRALLLVTFSTKAAALSLTMPAGMAPATVPSPGFNAPPVDRMVLVWPEKPDAFNFLGGVQTSYLLAGPASVRNLPPGDYHAAMWEEPPPQDLMRVPDFLARLNGAAASVTLKEGETSTVEPKVITREAMLKAVSEFP